MTSALPRFARLAALAVLAAVAYFASAQLGYRLHIPGGIVTLFPPAGVMLAFLLLSERSEWPALLAGGMAGSIASDLASHFAPGFALAAAPANALESLAAASLLRYRLGRHVTLGSLRQVTDFALGATVISNAVTAAIAAAVLHRWTSLSFAAYWTAWLVGDGLGMLIVAPAMLTIVHAVRARRGMSPRNIAETVALAVTLTIVLEVAHTRLAGDQLQPGLYLVFPVLFWAGLRFGSRGAALASLYVAGFTLWHAALNVGPFAGGQPHVFNTAWEVYIYLVVVALSSLIPAAVMEERAVAAERQRESEGRYRSVVGAATDTIIMMDDSGIIRFANPAAERVFGHTAEELLGKDVTMLMPERFRASHRTGLARYFVTGRRGIPWEGVELTGVHKDGHEIPLEVSLGERTERGRSVFTGILRDISEKRAAETALRRVEERMHFALDAASVGVWEYDVTSGEMRWSAIIERLHGVAPGTFAGTFDAFMQRVHPDDRAAVAGELERSRLQHDDANFLYRTTLPEGVTRWISGVGRMFYDAAGTSLRSAGIALDVTERHRLEEHYRQAQKMDAIGQLAGGIAHDFNNLLTAILAYGKMLEDSLEPGGAQHQDVLEIVRAAERAASLTRQLLAFSRQQMVAPRPTSLSQVLRSMEAMLRRLIGEHIDIEVDASANTGIIVADEGQLEQVILNLAINARDAMPEGGKLSLRVENVDVAESPEVNVDVPSGRFVLLTVTDTGTGMSPQLASRVFEPFFTTKDPGKGTGLGLSTVYGIVKQSGGAIAVHSVLGEGSTFRVYMPRTDASPAESTQRATEQPGAVDTILVTEDDAALRRLTQRILEKHGYTVLLAASPLQALEIIERHDGPIQLLLTDVVLPEMNGRTLAEQARIRRPSLRVLFMSGYTDDAVMHRGVRALDTHFVQKPFTQNQLLEKVREALQSRPQG